MDEVWLFAERIQEKWKEMSEWLYKKMAPYRAWLDTLPLFQRIVMEAVSIAIITLPFILLIWLITGEIWVFLPSA